MFCPQAIVWGDVATIASAIATFLAVLVALCSSRHAAELAKALHAAERKAELDNEARLRAQLAIAFDQELYMMIAQINFAESQLSEVEKRKSIAEAVIALKTCLPDKGMVLLDRFAADFVVFPPDVGANLLNSLGSWLALRDSPPAEFSDDTNLWEGVKNVLETLRNMSGKMKETRQLLRDFAPEGVELPPLDDEHSGRTL